MNEQWLIRCKKSDFAAISRKFNITPMFARILRNRDIITDSQIHEFLYGDRSYMHDPFLFNEMDKAVNLILDYVRLSKKIRIIGDYDADGVCSAYILESGLKFKGALVDVRIPDRIKDGYGMNLRMIEEAVRDNISLIITCDNGISAHNECIYAAEKGIDVIITDHHEPHDTLGLPKAFAVIDQKRNDSTYPYRDLCGAAVAYKLIEALFKKSDCDFDSSACRILDNLLIFASLATITDIVPLTGENRIIVKEGFKLMPESDNAGLNSLMKCRGINPSKIRVFDVGFIIGPCINSAGRLKSASISLELFETDDAALARELSKTLIELNELRKKLTEAQAKIAFDIIDKKYSESGIIDKILVVYLSDAHESLAGIIAGRIKEHYFRPAIVVTDSEGKLKGSARSTDTCNIIKTLSAFPELFEKFGGHASAAGFTLKDNEPETIELLSEKLNLNFEISNEDLIPKIWVDMQLPFEYISEEFVEELDLLEPTGVNNDPALFAEKNITVENYRIVGQKHQGIKMRLRSQKGRAFDAIMFNNADEIIKFETMFMKYRSETGANPVVSILFYPQFNEFRGKRNIQLRIESIRI